MGEQSAIHALHPCPDPRAVLVGLAAEREAGAEVDPFWIGGDLSLVGQESRPFILMGAAATNHFVPATRIAEGSGIFPWQPDAAELLAELSAFLRPTGHGQAFVGSEAGPEFFRGGVAVGWVGHELEHSRLARHEDVLFIDCRRARAWLVVAGNRGAGGHTGSARVRKLTQRFRRAEAWGRRLLHGHDCPPARLRSKVPASWLSVSPAEHCRRVDAVKERIAVGDVYQVNLAHPILLPGGGGEVEQALAFVRLLRANPVPFPAFVALADTTVMALTPERYLSRRGERVESRPIKGTRPRGVNREQDRKLMQALAASAKDRAENVMIVDLVRSDLGKVATPGGVRVSSLCQVETFASVHHLVSTVEARLRPGVDVGELLAAVHPPGSMTGAPKIRAVEILSALEGAPRGAYAGGVGWFAGDCLDLSMIIRSVLVEGGHAHLPVGGGIVADSDPRDEHQETLHKAASLISVWTPAAVEPARRQALP